MARIDPDRPLGIDAQMRSGFLLPLRERRAAASFFLGSYAVARTRAIKDQRERELMSRASQINDQVMAQLPSLVHAGVTEREVASRLSGLYKELGCDGFSFPPIVSFGANATDPHHEPDDTVLGDNQVVLFDIGGQYRDYCSDMTRTFFWGEPDETLSSPAWCVARTSPAGPWCVEPFFATSTCCARYHRAGFVGGPYFNFTAWATPLACRIMSRAMSLFLTRPWWNPV